MILTPGSYHVLQFRDHLEQQLDFNSEMAGQGYVYTTTYDEVSAMHGICIFGYNTPTTYS
eukprot:SAG11_NODE_33268_length_278_cov_0.849162_1_plen_59_part_10